MNPHSAQPATPFSLIRTIWINRLLILRMVIREVVGRYRGSVIGLGWSFSHPIIMLAVYTFVFSVVFQVRWGSDINDSKAQFAITLFSGLIIYNLFSEVLNRSPELLLNNAGYVKRVIFPLEILPLVAMGSALFHASINIGILLGACALLNGSLHWTIVSFPVVLLPLMLITLGFSWILTSLGVYLRDIGHIIGIFTTMLMFLTPIFYPMSAVPQEYKTILMLNPLTFLVGQARRVLIFGHLPDAVSLLVYTIASFIIAWLGYWWFQKTRKGFADVV